MTKGEAPQAARGSHPTTVLRLTPSEEVHWALIGQLMTRMRAFMSRFHVESDPAVVTTHLSSYWAAGSPMVACWVALTDEGRLIGHTVGAIEYLWGVPYGMIMQAEVDAPYTLTLAQHQAMLADLTAWAKVQGATSLRMLTPRNPDAWMRHSGFIAEKTLLRLPI